MKGLMLHCGSHVASREAVNAVATPENTETWFPVPHGKLLDSVEHELTASGLRIVKQDYGLWKDGARLFATWHVENGANADDWRLLVGIRNSHDKRFPAGLAVGSFVFVCDNESFSGEISLARKHTRYIERDLARLTHEAVGKIGAHRNTVTERIERYKELPCDDALFHDLLIRAVDAQAIPNARIPAILKEWREPRYDEFKPRTAWSAWNAFTEVLKGSNGLELPRKTTRLHGLFDLASVGPVPVERPGVVDTFENEDGVWTVATR